MHVCKQGDEYGFEDMRIHWQVYFLLKITMITVCEKYSKTVQVYYTALTEHVKNHSLRWWACKHWQQQDGHRLVF